MGTLPYLTTTLYTVTSVFSLYLTYLSDLLITPGHVTHLVTPINTNNIYLGCECNIIII